MKQQAVSEIMAGRTAIAPPARRRTLLKPAMAAIFLFGALLCSSAWAGPGGHGGGGHGGGSGHGGFHGGGGYHGGGFHGRGRGGIFIGGAGYWGYGPGLYGYSYPYSYYYDDGDVVVPQGAIVSSPPPALWYFCDNPQGYYPYVKECSTPWRAVTPDVPPPR